MKEKQILTMGFKPALFSIYLKNDKIYPTPGRRTYTTPYIALELFDNTCNIQIHTLSIGILNNGQLKFKGRCRSKAEFKRIVNTNIIWKKD